MVSPLFAHGATAGTSSAGLARGGDHGDLALPPIADRDLDPGIVADDKPKASSLVEHDDTAT